MIGRRCPNDASVIPLVGVHREWPQLVVRFFYCPFCDELFAYVGDSDLGGRYAGSFARERDSHEWRVWKRGDSERDLELATKAVEQIWPLP
jgi:hypothetical protein